VPIRCGANRIALWRWLPDYLWRQRFHINLETPPAYLYPMRPQEWVGVDDRRESNRRQPQSKAGDTMTGNLTINLQAT
jgi:hypothetical protein